MVPAVFIREMEQYIKYSIFFILKIGWLKGKQVRFLYDLVTVSREYKTMRESAVTEEEGQLDKLSRKLWEGGFV